MLEVVGEDGVEDPRETEHGVGNHDEVVRPAAFEGQDVAQRKVPCVSLQERKVHEEIPYSFAGFSTESLGGKGVPRLLLTDVYTINGGKCYVEG